MRSYRIGQLCFQDACVSEGDQSQGQDFLTREKVPHLRCIRCFIGCSTQKKGKSTVEHSAAEPQPKVKGAAVLDKMWLFCENALSQEEQQRHARVYRETQGRDCGSTEWLRLADISGDAAVDQLSGRDDGLPAYVARIPNELTPVAAGPIICAGVTTYKGIKVADCRPGDWFVVSGVGGLGHLAVQFAKAMGLRVAAVDIADDKLALAKKLGASLTFNAKSVDPVKAVQEAIGGAHGVLITAVSKAAFAQGTGMLRRGGTCVLNGLPPTDFPLSIFDVVFRCLTVRGSLVGTREDMKEALAFAVDGKVKANIETITLDDVNGALERLRTGNVTGRIVIKVS